MQRCAHEGVVVFKRLYETKKTFELVMEHCKSSPLPGAPDPELEAQKRESAQA